MNSEKYCREGTYPFAEICRGAEERFQHGRRRNEESEDGESVVCRLDTPDRIYEVIDLVRICIFRVRVVVCGRYHGQQRDEEGPEDGSPHGLESQDSRLDACKVALELAADYCHDQGRQNEL